jgi:3-dehydroquinate synthase
MGSGKTTVGEDLARRMGVPFVDLDALISEKSGASIPEIFRCAGQEAFRALEDSALRDLAAGGDPSCIVATGGGLPVNPLNRKLMKACGCIVYLKSSFENLAGRIPDDGSRPLWCSDARGLMEARTPFYEDADLVKDVVGRTIEDISREILEALPALPHPVGVILPDNPYPVHIGRGIFGKLASLLERHVRPEGLFALVDENVLKHHRRAVKEALKGCTAHLMAVPSGEQSKSMAFLNTVLDAMFARRVNRQWVCLAVGGGVAGDLAGFAASVYMRGIPVVQAATTLLAQVDSGIGGKTGVNNAYGKNLIGTFHQPLMVVSDVDFLATLGGVQLRSAMAEVVKYGIIMDRPLFEYLEAGPPFDYARIVQMCAMDKARVVARDEREGGLRRTLNFGHTLGHAVEKSTGYALSHGQAVAVGMAFASRLSHARGMLPPGDLKRIMNLMTREKLLPQGLVLPRPAEVAEALQSDKKGREGGVHFVLTPSIGGVSVQKLTEIEVLEAYQEFADGYSNML